MSLEEAMLKQQSISSGLGQVPIIEPTLAQQDPQQMQMLIDLCHAEQYLVDENGNIMTNSRGHPMKDRVLIYKDILPLIVSIGHLESTSNYTREQAIVIFADWEETEYAEIKRKHLRNTLALKILEAIRGIKRRQVYGDSQGAARQRFVVQVGGSERIMHLLTGSGEKMKRGLFGWLR